MLLFGKWYGTRLQVMMDIHPITVVKLMFEYR